MLVFRVGDVTVAIKFEDFVIEVTSNRPSLNLGTIASVPHIYKV
jgi:20S proteasome alpha/beta subunit